MTTSPARLGLGTALSVAMAAGPLTVFAVSALSPVISTELGLSRFQFGLLATASFAAATPAAFLSGRLVDRCRPRTALLLLFGGSAAALAVAAVAPGYGWLLVAMMTAGVAMSMSNPATNAIVSIAIPAGERGAMMGVKQSGVQIGQIVAGSTVPAVATLVGWRGAIAMLLIIVLLGAVSSWVFVPSEGDASRPRPSGAVATTPEVWTLLIYTFLTGAALQATNAYLPLFAFERLSFSASAAGFTLAVIGGTGLVARIWWGRGSDSAANPRRILLGMSGSGALASGLLLAASETSAAWPVWAAAILCGSTVVAANVVVMTMLLRLVPTSAVGSSSGLLAVGLYAGFTVGPASFGALADTAGYSSAWAGAGVAYLVGAGLLFRRAWSD